MDTLRTQLIERKVIELIEQHAEFRDVPYTPPEYITSAINFSAASGGPLPEAVDQQDQASTAPGEVAED